MLDITGYLYLFIRLVFNNITGYLYIFIRLVCLI